MLIVDTTYLSANSFEERNLKYQRHPVLSREDAKAYTHLLKIDDPLLQEINRILATYQSGIFQLSNGQKINATTIQLLGGQREQVPGAISVTISSTQDLKTYRYQAPPGKYIVSYTPTFKGKQKDIDLIDCSLSFLSSNSKITQTDTKSMERGGEGGVKGELKAEIPTVPSFGLGGSGGLYGNVNAKDEKRHEEIYSNQTVLLEVKAKRKVFESKGPVTVVVDVWIDDLPDKKEGKPLELESTLENVTIEEEGDLISIAGGEAASKETVDRTTKVASKIVKGKTKKGDIVSKATAPKEGNKEQLELSVDLDTLRSEKSNIAKELKELKLEKEKALEKYTQNESKPKIAESYWEDAEEAKKKIKEKDARMKVLEGQIDELLKKVGTKK